MFAIAFDMVVSDLKQKYREPYNNAYFEIGVILRKYGFFTNRFCQLYHYTRIPQPGHGIMRY